MEEDSAVPPPGGADLKEHNKRTSGIAGMFPFLQRPSMDTDNDSRSNDRPRKTGMGGGKVKPGFGSKHRHSASGDLHAGEPPSPLAGSQADSPSAAWASASYPPADVTDTLSLSQAWPGGSPAPVCTGTPTRSNSGFFKFPSFKKRNSNKGSASPGLPGSPTLAGATPTHGSNMSLSASGSSLSGAGGSQSPSESLCRAAGQHAGSKLGQYSSSGDPDEAEFNSCCSDAMHSPNMPCQEAAYGGDTLDLRQAGYAMPDASPMGVAMRQELPEVFTPGFNQLLDQGCNMGQQTPGTPLDNTAMLEPTVALLSSAQLAQAGQVYEVQPMLLSDNAANMQGSECHDSAAAPSESAGAGSCGAASKGQTLFEVEDVVPAGQAAAEESEQASSTPVAADDVHVDIEMESAPAAGAATVSEDGSSMPTPATHSMTDSAACQQQTSSTASMLVDTTEGAPAVSAAAVAVDGQAAMPVAADADAPAAAPVAAAAPEAYVCAATASAEELPCATVVDGSTAPLPVASASATEAVAKAGLGATDVLASPAAAAAVAAAESLAGSTAAAAEAGVTPELECTPAAAEATTQAAPGSAADTPAPRPAEPPAACETAAAAAAVSASSQSTQPCAEAVACSSAAATEAAAQADAQPAPFDATESVHPTVCDEVGCSSGTEAVTTAELEPPTQTNSNPASPEPVEQATAVPDQTAAASPPCAAATSSSNIVEQHAAAAGQAVPAAVELAVATEAAEQQQAASPEAVVADAAISAEVEGPHFVDRGSPPAAVAAVGELEASPIPEQQPSSTRSSPVAATASGVSVSSFGPCSEQEQQQLQQPCLEVTDRPVSPAAVEEQLPKPQSPAAPAAPEADDNSCSIHNTAAGVTSQAISAMQSECSLLEATDAPVPSVGQDDEQQQQASKLGQQEEHAGRACSPAQQQEQQLQEACAPVQVKQPAATCAAQPEAVAEPEQGQDTSGSLLPQPDFEPLDPEEPLLQPEASEEPVLPLDDGEGQELEAAEPSSPTAAAGGAASALQSCQSPVISARQGGPGSSRRSGRIPVSMVRESIPLFVSDPSRAVGSALVVEDSLDDQDMQQLVGDPLLTAGQAAAIGAAGAAAALGGRLLTYGGPQRVTTGFGSSQLNALSPVAECLMTSPIPEETSTGGSSHSRASSRYEVAIAGSPGSSPVRQLVLSGHSPTANGSPRLGMTPGSVYSTPTLNLARGVGAGSQTQLGGTPASAVSSAVGSAIRDVGSAGRFPPVDRNASLAMPDVSPTLALMSNMGGGGPQGASGDGSTPSLLDARAASPSAVYCTLYSTTPFRGALAALPIDAALNAPLVDSSPFNLTDDVSFDTAGFAQEAQRVAQNLAAAAAGGSGATPLPARTPGASMQQAMHSPGGTLLPDRMMSPTDGVRDLHVEILTKQLVDLQQRVKQLEGDNLRLREQVEIYEFEKTELNSQEEMEKNARQYAEEQLQSAQMELQTMRQAKNAQQAQLVALKQEFEGLRQEAARKHEQDKEVATALEHRVAQLQDERNQAHDRVNLLDMELTALRSNASGLQHRVTELEAAVATRDRDLQDMARIQQEAHSKLEKAVEQMIAAQTTKEHMRQKAESAETRAQQLHSERQQLLAEREKYTSGWQTLKAKYAQKSSTLKELEQRLQAKEAECQELMGMCDQLLKQQEAQ